MRLRYRPLLLLAAAVFVIGVVYYKSTDRDKCEGCQNVILISVDTLGAKYLGAYGKKPSLTPNLDKFIARRGVLFEKAYSQASWTLPSHTSMLTGRYPDELNMETPTDALPSSTLTLAESLKASGYQTHAISYGAFVHPEWGFDQGYDSFDGGTKYDDWEDSPRIYEEGIEWIKNKTNDRPYHLFLHSFYVHDPYIPPLDEKRAVTVKELGIANQEHGVSTQDADRFRTAYEAQLPKLDEDLGRFLAELESSGELDRSTVIITSDHGEEFGERGWAGAHGALLYDETLHVPLIIFSPDQKARRISDVVEVRSIPSTAVELSKTARADKFPGQSLVSVITGKQSAGIAMSSTVLEPGIYKTMEQNYAQLEKLGKSFLPSVREGSQSLSSLRSARSTDWKVIVTKENKLEVYNLSKDPEEKVNRSNNVRELAASDNELTRLLEILQVKL